MHFTRLKLKGFKSFCEATELPIEPGLTGIVGPNGCGKSNLLEALRWVMGETSAKRMRGQGMEDVIFAGTSGRAGKSHAEVGLVLDNATRSAPAAHNELDEIEITRRIERDMGSLYRINGKDARARDVQLLFADLSSGAHSPALVRQGQIGQLISAKPRDRRAILEEAAGISGLHARRHEAELRLNAAELNLTRLEDVVQEIEAQLSALKRQARQAQRYRTTSEQIRRLEALALHLRWIEAETAAQESESALSTAKLDVGRLTEESAAASRAEMETADGLPALREGEAEAAAAVHRLKVESETLDRDRARIADEIARLEGQLRDLGADLAREDAFLADAGEVLERMREERAGLEAAEAEAGAPLETAQERMASAKTELGAAETALDALTSELAQRRAERDRLERQVRDGQGRLEQLSREAEELAEKRRALAPSPEEQLRLENARAALSGAEESATEAARLLSESEDARPERQRTESEAREQLRAAEDKVAELKAEARALAGLIRVEEGQLFPPLIDEVHVAPGYEKALGAALGEDLDAALDPSAPRHWDAIATHHPPAPLPEGAAPLSQFVHGPPVLTRRLQQIGVVDTEEGLRLKDQLAPGQRLVSRHGDLWRWDGFVQASGAPSAAAERLAQRNRLSELEKTIRHASTEAGVMRDIYHARREEAESHQESERALRQSARQAADTLAAARSELADRERDAERRASQSTSLDERDARLERDRTELTERLAEDSTALGQLHMAGDGEADLARLREEVARTRAALAEAQAGFDRLRLEAESRRARLKALEADETEWRQRIETSQSQSGRLGERRAEAETALAEAAEKPAEIDERRRRLLDQVQIAETRRNEAADALALAETAHKDAKSARAASESALGQARESMARLEAGGEAARTRIAEVGALIRERLDCAPEEALSQADVDLSEGLPPREDVESKLDDLRRAREAMGAVNLRAEAEAEEHQTRLEELRAERTDLEEAISRLRQAISNLNREARSRLGEAFTVVAGHFERLFTHLFEGGQAELKLVESDDPLEAGLEIFARPPGKRLQTMSLLSGGEQALTAMALISAVFLANPAPICVLDEVDAPLDDTNVERFCNLIDELRRQTETRFLVITHHPLTMSRLDRLFGVTMAERGVSQLVSVDLEGARDVLLAS